MKANEVASYEANQSELKFVIAKRAAPGGTWFNIAKMLGRSENDVRRVYGFIDKLPSPADCDPRVKYGVPGENDGVGIGDGDGGDQPNHDGTMTARGYALRRLAREPMTADALAELTGWSQQGARRAFVALMRRGYAVKSHAGIWSITLKGREAEAAMDLIG